MKKSIIVFLFIAVCIGANSQDFRKCSWGDSWAKVKATEPSVEWSERSETANGSYMYFFTTEIGLLDALVVYYFIEDTFVQSGYIFMSEHTNENDFIVDFDNIKDNIEAKYGKVEVDKTWLNDLYRDDLDEYGFAISLGHYMLMYTVETDRTIITHALSGDNYEIRHGILYESKIHAELIEEAAKKAKSDIF